VYQATGSSACWRRYGEAAFASLGFGMDRLPASLAGAFRLPG
jgi:hypothetical protein